MIAPRCSSWFAVVVAVVSTLIPPCSRALATGVTLVEEPLTLPTYELGPAEKNPMFYTGESYQGAQKRIYPYAFQDDPTHVRQDRTYTCVRLENEFVRIRLLPELGGRLFEAVDKSNGYDFFYRQHVIKPALIGMLGAWISGGIEWCVFHHHRNTTFMPVDYTLVANADGSQTVWFGEIERRHRMQWVIGLTLYPNRSCVEATVRFFNRTALPHSILYWANVAVHVNDDYQVLFPPSVQVATYHSKTDFTQWPISRVVYRGQDYRGVDLSWWKNSPEANSFFAWNLQEDFMGGYDHGRQAGVVHVADHHVVCSAKLWEWGTGPSGRAWDKVLTDDDGPYAELMVGGFSDNQPDYSWIQPGEVKSLQQCWYPVRDIGGFKNANRDAALNLVVTSNGVARIGVQSTRRLAGAAVSLLHQEHPVRTVKADLGPERGFVVEVPLPAGARATDLRARVTRASGEEIIAYQPVDLPPVRELPVPVRPPRPPAEIENLEDLYLTGLRVEQIHNPTVDPTTYYAEVLRRDPGDTRANVRLGLNRLRRGLYAEAEALFRKALDRWTADYTRPMSTEAHFYLGLALAAQEQESAAEQFHRAAWDPAWRAAACGELAALAARAGRFQDAWHHVREAEVSNGRSVHLLDLGAAAARRLGRFEDARAALDRALALNPIDALARFESVLLANARGDAAAAQGARDAFQKLLRGEPESYLELASDYLRWGLLDEAAAVLMQPIETSTPPAWRHPLIHYTLGYIRHRQGRDDDARAHDARAAELPADYCFPFRLESARVLESALAARPNDARAWYYLGNLWYELQPERAIECWEKSRSLDDTFATTHRNLGWAFHRTRHDLAQGIAHYERALACDAGDPRLYLELDSLYEFANAEPQRRLALLERRPDVVRRRTETFSRVIELRVLAGRYDEAIADLTRTSFHVREGGNDLHDVWVDAHLLRGRQLLKAGDARDALAHFQQAAEYPENLSVGRPKNDRRAPQVAYHLGLAFEATGDAARAREQFQLAAAQSGLGEGSDAKYFQGLSWRKLGDEAAAQRVFGELEAAGTRALSRDEATDFFAKFGERETRRTRTAAAHVTLGLAHRGLGRNDRAREEFGKAIELNRSLVWPRVMLEE